MDKSHMFWSNDPAVHYGDEDHTPIPRVTYRCKGSAKITKTNNPQAVWQSVTHQCKLVTDHPRPYCLCICGAKFNRKETVDA